MARELGFGMRLLFQDQATAGMARARSQFGLLRQTGSTVATYWERDMRRISAATTFVRNTLLTLGAGFGLRSLFNWTVGGAAEFEQYRTSFEVMTGSAETAKKALGDLSKFAAQTPYELPEVVSAGKQLLSYGVAVDQLQPKLKLLGDAASGMNVPLEQSVAVWAKAKAGLFETEQFAQLGITREALQAVGVQFTKTGELVDRSKLLPAIERIWQTRFGDMMIRQSRTFRGVLSNLGDLFSRTGRVMAGMEDTGEVRAGSLFDRIRRRAADFYAYLDKNWNAMGGVAGRLGDTIARIFDGAVEGAIRLGRWVGATYNELRKTGALDSLRAGWESLVGAAGRFFAQAGKGARFDFAGTLGKALTLAGRGLDLLGRGIDWIVKNMDTIRPIALAVGAAFLWVTRVAPTLSGLATGLGALRAGIVSMLGPLGAVTSAVYLLYRAWEGNWLGIRDITAGVINTVRGAVGWLSRAFGGLDLSGPLSTVGRGALLAVGGFLTLRQGITTTRQVITATTATVRLLRDGFETLALRGMYAWDGIVAGFRTARTIGIAMFNGMTTAARTFTAVLRANPIIGAISLVIAAVTVLHYAWTHNLFGIRTAAQNAWNAITSGMSRFVTWAGGVWNGFTTAMSNAWQRVTVGAKLAWNGLRLIVLNGLNTIVSLVDPLMSRLPGSLGRNWRAGRDALRAEINRTKGEIGQLAKDTFGQHQTVQTSSLAPTAVPRPIPTARVQVYAASPTTGRGQLTAAPEPSTEPSAASRVRAVQQKTEHHYHLGSVTLSMPNIRQLDRNAAREFFDEFQRLKLALEERA